MDLLQFFRDILLACAVIGLVLGAVGVGRLIRLGNHLLAFKAEGDAYQEKRNAHAAALVAWESACLMQKADWAARCERLDIVKWRAMAALQDEVSYLTKKTKSLVSLDVPVYYDSEPFQELFRKENELWELQIFFGRPDTPPMPVGPPPDRSERLRKFVSACMVLLSCVIAYIAIRHQVADGWVALRSVSGGNAAYQFASGLIYVFSPIPFIAVGIAVIVKISGFFSRIVGSAILGLAGGLGALIRRRVVFYLLTVAAWLEVAWDVADRLLGGEWIQSTLFRLVA